MAQRNFKLTHPDGEVGLYRIAEPFPEAVLDVLRSHGTVEEIDAAAADELSRHLDALNDGPPAAAP